MPIFWPIDNPTLEAAGRYDPLPSDLLEPASQYGGNSTKPKHFRNRLPPHQAPPPTNIFASPEEIIRTFRAGEYLKGVVLVASWGSMLRQRAPAMIWRRNVEVIEAALNACAVHISRAVSSDQNLTLESPWRILTGSSTDQLGWSAVMASKTLHFLCRSLHEESRPPVPIDGAVIRRKLWPAFRAAQIAQSRICSKSWHHLRRWDDYARYMTAIVRWAEMRRWNTTQIENSIYRELGKH